MTKNYRGLLLVVLVSFISIAFVQPASAQAIAPKYVYGDDSTAGLKFIQSQDVDRWCWAATAAMIMAFHGEPQWLQCIQADDAYPGKSSPRTCCDGMESPLCNRTGWPHFEHYGFQYDTAILDHPLSWEDLVDQIDKKLPIAVAVHFKNAGGGGHMGAVVGYQVDKHKTPYVLAIDPDGFQDTILLRFDELFGRLENDGSYTSVNDSYYHWRTYYNIKK